MSRAATVSNFWNELADFPDFPQALCKNYQKPLWDFQLNEQEKHISRARRHNKAMKVCRQCVHQNDCYNWGYAHEMHGIWGGKVLIPLGRSYLRCASCNYPMVQSRYQKPPWGFRNRMTDTECTGCAAYKARKAKKSRAA